MNRLAALLELPSLVTRVWRQNQQIITDLRTLVRIELQTRGIIMALGQDTLDALAELDVATTEIADYIDSVVSGAEGIDDATADAIRAKTAVLRSLKPQDTVPGSDPAAEAPGEQTPPPATVEPGQPGDAPAATPDPAEGEPDIAGDTTPR